MPLFFDHFCPFVSNLIIIDRVHVRSNEQDRTRVAKSKITSRVRRPGWRALSLEYPFEVPVCRGGSVEESQ